MRRPLLLLALALTLAAPVAASARSFDSHAGRFGLGVELGYPSNGITTNTFLARDWSLQIVGTIWTRHDWLGLGARVDALWWMPALARVGWGDLVWYWGPGGNVFWYDWKGKGDVDGYVHLGAELPVGIGLRFSKVPIDLMLEVVPVFRVLGHGGLDFDFGIAGALHARWYF